MWTFDEDAQTWFYGTQLHGCGVYEESGRWHGNVSAYGMLHHFPDMQSKEQAQEVCLEHLKSLEEQ
ncbi:MAG: hypothetical protein DWQ19_13015 [Crenarchaeota archaeon]|nr:MAG: hypothetical protein DWQ19_13015 [Thermoproteota archaeon]